MTSLPRTAVDVARSSSFQEAVVVLDAVRRSCSANVLAAMLDQCAHWADVGKARRAVMFADPRSESALESLSRAAMHEHQLPPPQLQAAVRGRSGRWFRADFLWKERRLIGEADGAAKYVDRSALLAEKSREDDLRDAGYSFVRWTYGEMFGQTSHVIERIRRRLGDPSR